MNASPNPNPEQPCIITKTTRGSQRIIMRRRGDPQITSADIPSAPVCPRSFVRRGCPLDRVLSFPVSHAAINLG
ncbi:hypothetical protein CEXT_685761 [Caerostris extrusa]|uniref:Uncharacterized protein n=1 Tax=Caerostris extrusa TaxID=172846 RepID=A0AAV4N8C5_CAEEX|nr:hypothetical protein CEXT_685761 [Caerostris extrusa]